MTKIPTVSCHKKQSPADNTKYTQTKAYIFILLIHFALILSRLFFTTTSFFRKKSRLTVHTWMHVVCLLFSSLPPLLMRFLSSLLCFSLTKARFCLDSCAIRVWVIIPVRMSCLELYFRPLCWKKSLNTYWDWRNFLYVTSDVVAIIFLSLPPCEREVNCQQFSSHLASMFKY